MAYLILLLANILVHLMMALTAVRFALPIVDSVYAIYLLTAVWYVSLLARALRPYFQSDWLGSFQRVRLAAQPVCAKVQNQVPFCH